MASFLFKNKKFNKELLFINEDLSFSSTNDMISSYKNLMEENKCINQELDNVKQDNEYLRKLSTENHYPLEEDFRTEESAEEDFRLTSEEDMFGYGYNEETFLENNKEKFQVIEELPEYKQLDTYTNFNEKEIKVLNKDFCSIKKRYMDNMNSMSSGEHKQMIAINMFKYLLKIIMDTKLFEKKDYYYEKYFNSNITTKSLIKVYYQKIEEYMKDSNNQELNDICLSVKQALDYKLRMYKLTRNSTKGTTEDIKTESLICSDF